MPINLEMLKVVHQLMKDIKNYLSHIKLYRLNNLQLETNSHQLGNVLILQLIRQKCIRKELSMIFRLTIQDNNRGQLGKMIINREVFYKEGILSERKLILNCTS